MAEFTFTETCSSVAKGEGTPGVDTVRTYCDLESAARTGRQWPAAPA